MKKKEKYSLSKVSNKDLEILYFWRNQKSVRKWSFKKNKISKNTHTAWFKKNSKSKKSIIKIFRYNNLRCGMVRLNLLKKNYNLNYLIDQKYRKKKLGKKMLSLFLKEIYKEINKKTYIIAKSEIRNISSNKCLLSVGFKLINKNNNVNKYIYKTK